MPPRAARSLADVLTVVPLALLAALQIPAVERVASVHLRLDQDGGVAPANLNIAIDEVRAIWNAAGVLVTVGRYAAPAPLADAVISVRIVGDTWGTGKTPVLGRTFRDRQARRVTVFISAPGVRQFVAGARLRGTPLNQLPSALVEELEARALGRVLAHEVGHCLLPDLQHSASGLMRGSFTPDDLVAPARQPFMLTGSGVSQSRIW